MSAVRRLILKAAKNVWRSPSLQIALVFLPMLWMGYFAISSSEKAEALQQARQHGDSVVKLFQENTERMVERVDQSLRLARAIYASDPATFSLKFWADKAQFASGDVIQFSMIGLDGYMFDTTTGYTGTPLYLGDRDHFVGGLKQDGDHLYVGRSVMGRASKKWTIQLSRKLFGADQSAVGIIVGSINVDVVDNFFDRADLGDGGSIVLRNADYVILAAHSVDRERQIGQRAAGLLEQEFNGGGYAQYWSEANPNHSTRLITARKSTLFPLIFTAGISENEIYARYYSRQTIYLSVTALMTLIILATSAFHWRRQQALERTQRELRETASKFDDAMGALPQGLSMFDGSGNLIAFNRQWLDLYGLPPEEIRIGMTFHELFRRQTATVDVDLYLADLKGRLARSEQVSNTVTFPDGRVVYISYGLRQDGGWVATHEDVTQRKASEDRIEKLAHYDALTGLANRNLFKERVEETLAQHRRLDAHFAVLLLDLDRFKAVNDVLGHQSGDTLLKEVADRIRAEIRDVDTAARIGGDEFALIVTPGDGALQDGAAVLASRLVKAISAPYEIDGHPVVVGCSIGIAVVPEHGSRIDEILRNADLALYKSKNSGRNCFSIYSDALKAEADQRSILEIELREAIWREEIEVYYQPVIDLDTGQAKSVEALARWRHATRGFIPPAVFIPVAEEGGLIVELGNLVLAKACRDATKMPDDIKVAVNLSATQFAKSDVVDSVIFGLVDARLPEPRLEIEITESVFLADSEENLKTLQRLRKLGVSIALDDFGVGYSSLSYLTAFAFNKVKIDKSFIDRIGRPETVAVLASIVQLAKTLNLSIVAEGIETPEQVEKIRALGIPLGQGYYFSRPVPLAELTFEPYKLADAQAVA